jgi:hypothetical protein
VCNALAETCARVIVCGTAMTLGLHSWLASAVGKVPVGEGMGPAALGHHLRAWSRASASQYLSNFIIRSDVGGAGDAGGVGRFGDAAGPISADLDITDVPGLFPCA